MISLEEAPTVQYIYNPADQYGYGGRRMSSELKENCFLDENGFKLLLTLRVRLIFCASD